MSNRLNLPEIGKSLRFDQTSLDTNEKLLWYRDISPASVAWSGARGKFTFCFFPILAVFMIVLCCMPFSTLDDQSKLFLGITLGAIAVFLPLLMLGIAYLSPFYRRTYILTTERILIVSAKNHSVSFPYELIRRASLHRNPIVRSRGKVTVSTSGQINDNPLINPLNANFYGNMSDAEKVYQIILEQRPDLKTE